MIGRHSANSPGTEKSQIREKKILKLLIMLVKGQKIPGSILWQLTALILIMPEPMITLPAQFS